MVFKFFCGIIGFGSGFLLTKLVTIGESFNLSTLLINFILNPFLFFATMVCFLISFVTNAILFKEAILQTKAMVKRQTFSPISLGLGYTVIISFFILFLIGFWQTLVLSLFTIIYGIISIDFKKNVTYEHGA